MTYLIDTDIVLDHLAAVPAAIELLNELANNDDLAVSSVTYLEAYQAVLRSSTPREAREQFEAFVAVVQVLPFLENVARRCAELRELLRIQGKRVRSRALDLIIAATALESSAILVTRNTRDYADIPRLRLYQT